jgi:two-component sensor histidine kinase
MSDSVTSDCPASGSQSSPAVEDAGILAQAIIDTVDQPFVVLDDDLRVVTASRSFCLAFKLAREDARGRLLYDLGEGQWDIAELRTLLEKILPEHGLVEGFEVDRAFPGIGRRALRLSARRVPHQGNRRSNILLTMTDVTATLVMEQEMKELMWQKEVLLKEMRRRVANSATLIASILMLKAKTVPSEEMRQHLQDVHQRVMLVAAAQDNLHVAGQIGLIEIAPYLSRLCQALTDSMIGESRPLSLKVEGGGGHLNSAQAVSIGLIVTELVLNALKHAFPPATRAGQIAVAYEIAGIDWKLSVSDNGIGVSEDQAGPLGHERSDFGTSIVKALTQQLGARVEVLTGPTGTTVSVTHATFAHVSSAHAWRTDHVASAQKRRLAAGALEAPCAPSSEPPSDRNEFAA